MCGQIFCAVNRRAHFVVPYYTSVAVFIVVVLAIVVDFSFIPLSKHPSVGSAGENDARFYVTVMHYLTTSSASSHVHFTQNHAQTTTKRSSSQYKSNNDLKIKFNQLYVGMLSSCLRLFLIMLIMQTRSGGGHAK